MRDLVAIGGNGDAVGGDCCLPTVEDVLLRITGALLQDMPRFMHHHMRAGTVHDVEVLLTAVGSGAAQ